jgi:hypothetical protein
MSLMVFVGQTILTTMQDSGGAPKLTTSLLMSFMTPKKQNANSSDDLKRASEQIAARLRALGISLSGSERPEDLVRVEEAVERFEEAVEARGGDLMVDEGPRGAAAEPDDPHFSLPLREGHEPIAKYLERIARTTDVVRRHRKID